MHLSTTTRSVSRQVATSCRSVRFAHSSRLLAFAPTKRSFSSSSSSSSHDNSRAFSSFAHANTLGAIALTVGVVAYGLHCIHESGSIRLEAPAERTNDDVDGGGAAVRLDPATSQPLPVILPTPQSPLPRGSKELVLVGLGVRTVSFLSIRVYVAGLYVDAGALEQLAHTPGWRGFQADWFHSTGADRPSGEALMSALLDQGVPCAIRIVPVRSTDYNHLRDGFTRAVQGRAKLARKANTLSAEADEQLNAALQELKDAFPRASLPKGHALDLIFTPAASASDRGGMDLTLEEGGKILGSVRAPRNADKQHTLARQLLLAYLADKDEISKPFKQSVAQGFEQVLRGRNA